MQGCNAIETVAPRQPIIDDGAVKGLFATGENRFFNARRLDAFARKVPLLQGARDQPAVALVIVGNQHSQIVGPRSSWLPH
jgi:hypothetical protein